MFIDAAGQIATAFLHPNLNMVGPQRIIMPFSMCLSPGEETEPTTPVLLEETQEEDAKKTFKESRGMYKTLLGKMNNEAPLITNYPRLNSLLCSFP